MSFILWIILGALAGWIASMIIGNDAKQGWLGNIIVGVVGAFVGGWLIGLLIPSMAPSEGFNIGSLIVATLGAIIVLFVFNMVAGKKKTI